tara:strand:+ start:3722 stop:4654 length:933 start_codon:yes stop_codon:yes gene_type:complete
MASKMKNKFSVYSFYRFTKITDKKLIKNSLDKQLSLYHVRGTILLADEGINGTLSAKKKDLDKILKFIRNTLKIRKLNLKVNKSSFLPFNRMKVRLKKEIVSLGKGVVDISSSNKNHIDPSEWNKFLKNKDIKVIDVRNNFEIDIGKFRNAINPKTKSFREFPKSLKKMKIDKNDTIAMYCTGGIRCEKVSAFLKINGYKNIYQLKGGIINYLDYVKNNNHNTLWKGECFVFDNRVTINKELNKGKYIQCFGCRRPITKKDTLSANYIKGVSCPYCYNERSEEQKKKSRVRQNQIENARDKNKYNIFLKN